MRSVLGLAGAAFLVYSAVRLRVSLPLMVSSVLQLCVRCIQGCVLDATSRWGQEAAELKALAADGLPPQVRNARSTPQRTRSRFDSFGRYTAHLVEEGFIHHIESRAIVSSVWSLSRPAPVGEDVPRRTSKLGFDITPLTAEQREEAAARLNAFQRCHPCKRSVKDLYHKYSFWRHTE